VMIQISALRSRLEKQPTDLRPYASYIRDDALVCLELENSAKDSTREGKAAHLTI
jgi:hypothetical protein